MSDTPALIFSPPSKDAPGYLRRMRRAVSFQERLQNPTTEVVDDLIDFLLDYVSEPKEKKQAREILMDASENQFAEMLSALAGSIDTTNPT